MRPVGAMARFCGYNPAMPEPTPSQRFHRQSRLLFPLVAGVIPGLLLLLVLLVDGDSQRGDLARALLALILAQPPIALANRRITRRPIAPMLQAIDLLAAGEAVPEAVLQAARRMVFRFPWITAGNTLTVWGLFAPAILYWGILLLGGHPGSGWGLALAGLIVGPLAAMLLLFTVNALLRRHVALLFPNGGVNAYEGASTLTVLKRNAITFVFTGPYALCLLSALLYRQVAQSRTVPEALARMVPMATLLVAVIVVLGAVLVFGFYGGTVGRPMVQLARAMRQVQEGQLELRLPVESNDNLGVLVDHFNAMVEGLRERERIRDALGRYVSPQIARQAITGDLRLGGELREVSVLFSDIRGFTTLAEGLEAEALVELLNRYFQVMVACIRAEGGSVNKFLGDGLMALFGAPDPLPDAPGAAVRSAIAMERALTLFNADQRFRGGSELAIGIGIATGPVVVGNVGSADRLEYTAIGDTVNTASRIEGLTKELGATILLDARTSQGLSADIATVSRGSVSVKGKQQPVAVHALLVAPVEASS